MVDILDNVQVHYDRSSLFKIKRIKIDNIIGVSQMAKLTLIPLKGKIAIIARSYIILESYIKKRMFQTEYTPASIRKAKREIEKTLKTQDDFNEAWISRYFPQAYNESSEISRAKLESLGQEVKKKKFDTISKKTQKMYAIKVYKRFLFVNDEIRKRVDQYFRLISRNKALQNLTKETEIKEGTERILKAAQIPTSRITLSGFGYEAAASRGEVQRAIKELYKKTFGEFDFIEIVTKTGKIRKYKPTGYIKMVARTEMRRLQTAATIDRCGQYDNDLVQISSHDNPCLICMPFEGQIYSISGKHPTYEKLMDSPPYHPNCEHTLNPTTDTAIKIEKKHGKKFPEPIKGLTVESRIAELKKAA